MRKWYKGIYNSVECFQLQLAEELGIAKLEANRYITFSNLSNNAIELDVLDAHIKSVCTNNEVPLTLIVSISFFNVNSRTPLLKVGLPVKFRFSKSGKDYAVSKPTDDETKMNWLSLNGCVDAFLKSIEHSARERLL